MNALTTIRQAATYRFFSLVRCQLLRLLPFTAMYFVPACAFGMPFNLRVQAIPSFKFMKRMLFNGEPKDDFL